MRHIVKINLVLILCLMFVAGPVAAGVKERMQARAGQIGALKAQGIVGENNRGYLGFVGSNKTGADIVAAENKDRKAVYMYMASKQGTTVEVIEQVQAGRKAKIAQKAGQYYQAADGSWKNN